MSAPSQKFTRPRGQTVRLCADAWRQLKIVSLNEARSVHDIMLGAIDEYLQKHHGETLAVQAPVTYLMADTETYLCKVGISKNPLVRLSTHKGTPIKELDGISPQNIQIIRAWNPAVVTERRLIDRAAERLAAVGKKNEWFIARSEREFRDFLCDLDCEPFISEQVFAA